MTSKVIIIFFDKTHAGGERERGKVLMQRKDSFFLLFMFTHRQAILIYYAV